MGYYARGYGHISIRQDQLAPAYEAMCELNQHDDMKNGGSWGGGGVDKEDTRPAGMNYHPARWFSWLDADYPTKCGDFDAVLKELGFDFSVTPLANELIYTLTYDNKVGQEDLFFEAIAPFVSDGQVEWVGEDESFWKWQFENGEIRTLRGTVVYE